MTATTKTMPARTPELLPFAPHAAPHAICYPSILRKQKTDPGWTFNASLHAKRFASMQAARDCLVFAILLTILSSNRLSKEPQISSAKVHKIMINARAGRGFHLAVQLEPCMH